MAYDGVVFSYVNWWSDVVISSQSENESSSGVMTKAIDCISMLLLRRYIYNAFLRADLNGII